MWTKLLIIQLLVLLVPGLSDSSSQGCQSSQEVVSSIEGKLQDILANFTNSISQVDEILAPVSTFLQAALVKQVLAEYGVTPSNTSSKNDPLLYKILNQTAANHDAILGIYKNLTELLQNVNSKSYTPSTLLHSCEEIKSQFPDSPSDYYIIADGTGHARHVYCQMEQVCGSSGWTRVAYLNMSDLTEECPSGFRLYNQNGVRACGRPVTSGGSCQSVRFPSFGITYSDVCGRVHGYQKGSTDAIPGSNLNGMYVDGVSLTHGNPRQHIWTFVATLQENFISGALSPGTCPCATGSTQTSPSFVGNDYFCESGCLGHFNINTFYSDDRLWDGQQCGHIEGGCCQAPGLPWFHKTLPSPSSDYIELRICCDQGTADEDVPVGFYEIYVK